MKIALTTVKQAQHLLDGNVESPHTEKPLTRRHDDTDGSTEPEHEITVCQGPDGDMYIGQGLNKWLRFRTAIGGTNSPRVHNALRFLAIAIEMDNKDYPLPPHNHEHGS